MIPRRITHVISGLATGGAEMMLLKLLSGMDRERWAPSVVALRDRGPIGLLIEQLGVSVASLGISGSVPGPQAALRLWHVLRAQKPSLIQGWMYHGNLAALVAQVFGPGRSPVIWGVRCTVYDFAVDGWATGAVVRLGSMLSSRAARIVYNSRIGARQHAEIGYSTARAVVIPNGFNTDLFTPSPRARAEFRQRLGIREDEVLIGRVGRYHAMKDYSTFLRAAALLSRERPHVRFVVAGSGVIRTNPEFWQQVQSLGLVDVVHPIGEIHAVADLMAALDIACSSSAFGEGFPNVLGEAMACGVPCVATSVGDEAWLLSDTGLVVTPGDAMALAAACRVLVDVAPEERQQLGARARARIVREFSLSRVVAEYEQMYDDALI